MVLFEPAGKKSEFSPSHGATVWLEKMPRYRVPAHVRSRKAERNEPRIKSAFVPMIWASVG